ncbi:LysR substrate-binding domain-containing protein [Sphingosinicella ginsenosidimutans]|nr:LysR family transcriptional regulator [Sphingosinicella ginsenosidimutans]
MRIRDLECYIRVCEVGSINRAASDLNIAQPALGLILKRMEHEFGAQLFVRHARGVTTTGQGDEVCRWAREVIEGHRRMRERLAHHWPRELRIGLPPSAASLLAVNLPAASQRWMPGTEVHLLEESSHVLVEYVASNALDLALTFQTPGGEGLESQPVLDQALYLVGGPDAFGPHETIRFAKALDRDLVMSAMPASVRFVVEREAEKIGLRPRIVHELKSLSLLKEFVSHGMGAAILPLGSIAEDLRARKISAARIIDPEIRRTLSIVRRRAAASDDAVEVAEAPLLRCIRSTLPKALPEGLMAPRAGDAIH